MANKYSIMDDEQPIYACNSSYVPTSSQYFEGLGSYSSTVLIMGGLVTLVLFILFFEQVVYTNQTAHRGVKRNIYWIASVFPIMTLMSLIALAIPRASDVCLSVKMIYISIGISHFTDLTMVMFGGEEQLVERGAKDTFNLRLQPLCCCCRCLPDPPVTKYSLRLILLMTDQFPFAQAIYYVIVLILLAADNITMGDVKPSNAFLWLNIFKLASALIGVYGFMILSRFSKGYLDEFMYRRKSRAIRLLLLITSFQSMIFNIMANYGAFPCIPPYISPTVYKQTVDNSLYLVEMMILGPYTYWQYHDQMFAKPITAHSSSRGRSESTATTSTRISTITTSIDSDSEDNIAGSTLPTNVEVLAIEDETKDPGNTDVDGKDKPEGNSEGNGDSLRDSTRKIRDSTRRKRDSTRGSHGGGGGRDDSSRHSTRDRTNRSSKRKTTPVTDSQENL